MFRRFRFGFLSLFVAMLLAISVGGWWKFHRDLYLEEQAVLAELAKGGCETNFLRVPAIQEESVEQGDESGNPYFDRVRVLFVEGSPSPRLIRRAAMLPKLDLFYIRWEPRVPPNSPSPAYTTADLLSGAAPQFAQPRLVEADLELPHPIGERMNDADQASTIAAIRSSWDAQSTAPTRFVRSLRRRQEGYADDRTFARDGIKTLSYVWQDGRSIWLHLLQIGDGEALYDLHDASPGWRLSSRDRESTRGYPTARADEKEELISWPYGLASRTDSAGLAHVEAVERIDDDRVRLTFRPFERPDPHSFDRALPIREASLVLREDLNWRPESVREMEDDSTIAEERRYERIGNYVLPIEILASDDPQYVVGRVEHLQFAWRIDPTFEPGTFSPNRFLAEPIAPPQELPLWRWYYGTMAAGIAMALFLLGRSTASLFGRRRRPTEEKGPTPGS